MKEHRPAGLRLLTFLLASALFGTTAFAETLTIPGTGACEPLLAELAEVFNRSHSPYAVAVPPSIGSGGGISAVLKEEAVLARVARPLKPEETKEGLVQQIFARDAVAFVVGRQVKIDNLSSDQLVAIFSGKTRNWKELGKPAGVIRVVTREPGDASLSVIQKHMPGFKEMIFAPGAKVILYDQAAVEALDKFKNAIGFITLSSTKWAKGPLRPLRLDGIAPTRENILAGKYRLMVDYSFVSRKNPTPAAKNFVDFVFSQEGRKVIERNGLIAVDKK